MPSEAAHPGFTILPAYKLKGHNSAVLCCAAAGSRIASGAEDGRLLVHDLRSAPCAAGAAGTADALGKATSAAGEEGAVPGLTSPSAAAAPTARPLVAMALTGPDGQPAAVAAVAANPASPETSIFAAAGSLVHHVDFRAGSVVQTYGSSREDVNGLCVNGKGSHLAAGDDAGEVQVYDMAAGRLFKGIRNVHRSICSSVAFRVHKPWDLLSGGLDSTVAKYDFSRPKCVDRWDMGALTGSGSGGGGGSGGQIFNPPFVHQVAVPPGDTRPACQWVAAARGDGAVVVLDADASSAASGSSGPTTPVALGFRGAGRGLVRGGPSRGGGSGGPMRPLVLDRDDGGHTRPVCSVAFAPSSTEAAAASAAAAAVRGSVAAEAVAHAACRLYSAGEDCRVILWDVGGALEARAAGVSRMGPAALEKDRAVVGEGDVRCGTAGAARGVSAGSPGRSAEGGEEGTGEEEGLGEGVAVLAEVRHGRKVNQLCCTELEGSELVAVAAVSKFVVVYRTHAANL